MLELVRKYTVTVGFSNSLWICVRLWNISVDVRAATAAAASVVVMNDR